MRRSSALLLAGIVALAAPSAGARTLSAQRVAGLVEDAVLAEAAGLPGRVEAVDVPGVRPLRLPSGPHSVHVRFLPGEDFAGPTRTEVIVRRGRRVLRRVWLTARVRRLVPALRAARRLRAGELLGEDGVEAAEVLAERLPAGALSDPAQAVGLQMRSGMSAGRVLVGAALQPPHVVRRGDRVRLVAASGLLTVSVPGRVEGAAARGALVSVVNLVSGRSLRGRVRDSRTVEVGVP